MDHGGNHGGGGGGGDNPGISPDSPALDLFLQLHAACMTIGFAILIPLGAVLGMVKSKYHRTVQITGAGFVAAGVVLAQFHSSRHIPLGPHQVLGWLMVIGLGAQIGAGFALKTHLRSASARVLRMFHSINGKAMFVLPYAQLQFGVIAMTGMCWSIPGYHMGQCLAHFIMGSAFIGYGCFVMLRYFNLTRESLPLPDDAYDSMVIMCWGIVNTFTEHKFGERWSHGDMQHTSMGILWWFGGMLAVFVSFKLRGSVVNVFPSVILGITGIAMALHFQHRAFSTMLHAYFGVTLMLSSLVRILSMYWSTGVRGDKGNLGILTAFLLVQSGILFMGSNEETLAFLDDVVGIDPASYGMLLCAAAFLITLWMALLIFIYVQYGERRGDFADGPSTAPTGGGAAYSSLETAPNVLVADDYGIAMESTPLRSPAIDSDGTAGVSAADGKDSLSFDLGVVRSELI